MVLIISSRLDEHTLAVASELSRLGVTPQVLDLSEFPVHAALEVRYAADSGQNVLVRLRDGTRLDLRAVQGIWWRRPQPLQLDTGVSVESHRRFAMNECHEAISGLWQCLDARWINRPWNDDLAHRKAYQLRVAQKVGLAIPNTLITNDPAAAREFIEERDGQPTIYKAFSATQEEWRETRLVRAEELNLLDSVRFAPVIFQEYVTASYDLRVTVVGDDIFPAAIYSQETAYKIDCRMDIARARIEAVSMPEEIIAGLHHLMSELGLVYGAVDMRLTPEGRYVFLEINPAGQWLFVENRTKQPIAACLAGLLAGSQTR